MLSRGVLFLACALLILPPSSYAQAADADACAMGDPLEGKRKAQSENCQECHGLSGAGLSPAAPRLSGQHANYLVKQLQDFKSGERLHPVMNSMAESLAENDMADIAAWFSSNPPMSGSGAFPSLVARDIFSRGDASRNLPPCQSCHGESGRGRYSEAGSYPAIGGQHRAYLREQLRNWRSGARHNSSVMNFVARSLSDDEIEALAGYISGLQ